jgi:hypothetical protein
MKILQNRVNFLLVLSVGLLFTPEIRASVWQWSVEVTSVISVETNAHPRAFLWIPENCKQVRAVIIGQHNMSEENIFEHPRFRKEMAKLCIAEVWVTPAIDMVFDFNQGAGEKFEGMLSSLAEESGYSELKFAPVIPIGHSACASYPWNFAAWNPERTLAILSEHGDAPLTNLTGSGRPNPDWGNRYIDGVPGLMVEGEFEWWEDRVQPALNFRQKSPQSAISFFCDAGRGHFDVSDQLVDYLALFIRKAVQYRMPEESKSDRPVRLIPVNPENGWLKERWRRNKEPEFAAAPYALYKGDRKDAFWYFDKEMARKTEKCYARGRGKTEQYIGFIQGGKLLPFDPNLHARIAGNFVPEHDGLTFHLKAECTDTLRTFRSKNHGKGSPVIDRICGPVEKINDSTFTVRFYQMGFENSRRTGDIWLLASHPGDREYKSSVQQITMRIPIQNKEGLEQQITFEQIPDVKEGTKILPLKAVASSGMPVYFYVREGPAEVKDGKLILTRIPLRSSFPVKVTVVAWQYGRSLEPKVQTADPVNQSFLITKKLP